MAMRDSSRAGEIRARERGLADRFAKNRSTADFAQLVASTRPWLVSLCERQLGGDRHAAEDVSQDCYVKAYLLLANGGSILDVRAWLSTVARNGCVDEMRRNRPVPVAELPDPPAELEDALDMEPPLEAAWTSLEPRQRRLIFLREFMGMSYREIAQETDTTLPAVETALFRARSSLRRRYHRAGGRVLGLGWIGLGPLRRLFRGEPRWAAFTRNPVGEWLGRVQFSGPSQAGAGAASLAVAVLATGLLAGVSGSGPTAAAPPAAVRVAPAGGGTQVLVSAEGRGRATKDASGLAGLVTGGHAGNAAKRGDGHGADPGSWQDVDRIATFTGGVPAKAVRVGGRLAALVSRRADKVLTKAGVRGHDGGCHHHHDKSDDPDAP